MKWQNIPGSIISFDPNNIPIEFSAPFSGLDIRKSPKMKDKDPTAITEEGVDPQAGHWPEVKKATPMEDRIIYPGEGMDLI